MKLYIAVVALATVVCFADAAKKCGGDGKRVWQFSGKVEQTRLPCKYFALKGTQCGKYRINITPGNVYLHPKWRLNSLWISVTDMETGAFYDGRADNKRAVKFYNGWKDTLFSQKDGTLNGEDLFNFDKLNRKTYAKAKNGDFAITFMPYDPDKKGFQLAQWEFLCYNVKEFLPTNYSEEVCGGLEEDKQASHDLQLSLGLDRRDQVVYYNVFTNPEIVQTNPKCDNATSLMLDMCDSDEMRVEAMRTCTQILRSNKHTKCVTKYACDPMDVFVDCVDWVCSNYDDDYACERVGKAIDMCRTFTWNDLSDRVEDRNCYKEFLNIVKQPEPVFVEEDDLDDNTDPGYT